MNKLLGIIAVILLGIAAYFGYTYWNDTYNGEVAYAVTPPQFPDKEVEKDARGQVQPGLYSYNYELNFVTANGAQRTLKYSVTGENPIALPLGTPVKALISKKRVLDNPTVISFEELPENVKPLLSN